MILDFAAIAHTGHIKQMMLAINHRGPDAENYGLAR